MWNTQKFIALLPGVVDVLFVLFAISAAELV
jgi:hypothetical protein